MAEKIRVLVADDHAIVVSGLAALLATEPDLELVGTAADGIEAVIAARQLQPDVVLLDLQMPRKDGIQALTEIRAVASDARILILTSFDDDERVFAAMKNGALGYLLKDTSPAHLLDAIRNVAEGKATLHPDIALKLIHELHRPTTLPPTQEPLTARELEVLKLVARGLSNQEIAAQLTVSERTVRTHISNILGKLHLANRTQAALYALKEGWASLDDVES
jgi:NarL family two-component system response regulator LiaR